MIQRLAIILLGLSVLMTNALSAADSSPSGLIVHLGCGDGKLTAELGTDSQWIVQGLDTDASKVAAARRLLDEKELTGPVSVDLYDGVTLPYANNLVNKIIVSDQANVANEEIMRVLAPEGVAEYRTDGKVKEIVKPRPADIDEWNHFLHDSGGNAVAKDRQIGSPKSLRWISGPKWARSHEFPSSVAGVVTAGGRIFTILDEAPTGVYKKLPQAFNIVAQDAFNGAMLWKVPLKNWQPEDGTGTGNRWNIHHTIPRRIVTNGERVYVTLQFLDSPVSVLDAATGKILVEAYEGTEGADELILCDGTLIVKSSTGRSVGATSRLGANYTGDTLSAVDTQTGKLLWQLKDICVAPYALSAKDGRVVFHSSDELVCLDLKTGADVWHIDHKLGPAPTGTITLVVIDDVVLFHGMAADKGEKTKRAIWAFDLKNGSPMWQRGGHGSLAAACTQPTDIFVTHGLVWYGNSLEGVDLKTGEVKQTLSIGNTISPGHHYRCHRAKATERYLIWPKRGAEFLDTEGNEHMRNDWLRAPCFTGATPANGLFYAPSDQCFCYPGVKVNGYLALSADKTPPLEPSGEAELVKGPAYGKVDGPAAAAAEDWPIHRSGGSRSGSTATTVSAELQPTWEIDLTCQGTQPVVVDGKLFVAEKDAHRVRCFDAKTGEDIWSFTAGGRIDSTPTVSGDLVIFGCRDGRVYCLRTTDGELVWSFRAAPAARQIVAYDQVESVWPVHGSVLIEDGRVYFAAGRSSYLDGGIMVYAVDAKTGKVLNHHLLDGPWPDITTDKGTPFHMSGSLNDLIVSDGTNLFMQRVKFDKNLNRIEPEGEYPLGELDMGTPYLTATGGFLDDSGYDRIFWMHSNRWPGFYLAQQSPKAGQLVVFDDTTTYAVKYFYRRIEWSPVFYPASEGYILFADANDNEPAFLERGAKNMLEWLPAGSKTDHHRRGGRGVEKGTGYIRTKPALWQEMVPLRIRAMVLAEGDRLFTAGAPDVLEPEDPLAAFESRAGGRLQVFSTTDGSPLAEYELKEEPTFDGMSAAEGRLYMTTKGGKLICFGKK